MESMVATVETAPEKGMVLDGIRELSRGNEQAALEAFAQALEGSDETSTAALCSARRLILRRDFQGAVELLEGLVEWESDLAEAHFLLGKAHQGCYRTLEAVHCYRRALALDPADRRSSASLHLLHDVQEP